MRLSYLELRNYRRFREAKVQFPDGIVGIVGLNGSGKTTLIEAVAWALFGNTEEVVRTSRESVKMAGSPKSEPCSAALEFELGGSEYRVEREMGGKNLTMKASLRTGGTVIAEGDRPVKKAVEKLIGMDHKSFFTSVFARQKELNALQNVAAGERKKAVLRMLRIDGVDDVLQRVRTDRRGAEERIRGAESTLMDDQGRDREAVLREQLPDIAKTLEDAETLLKAAEAMEAEAKDGLSRAKAERDELRKDFEAHTSTAKDLHAKRSSAAELAKTLETLDRNIREAEQKLKRLPGLESEERAWSEATAAVDALEEGRRRHERAKHLADDIASDRAAAEKLRQELAEASKALSAAEGLAGQRDALEKSREESEKRRREVSDMLGELRARKEDREKTASERRTKLDEIATLGKEGRCPTCERVLEDAYELLVTKFTDEGEQAAKAAAEAAAEIERLRAELKGLDNLDEAVRKKAKRLEQETDRLRALEARSGAQRRQLVSLEERVGSRSADLAALGEVRFSREAYDKARSDRDRLKPLHDDFVRLKGTEEELRRLRSEGEGVRARVAKVRLETDALARTVAELEPKKDLYDKISKVVDDKMTILNKAKDEARARANKRDSAKAELGNAERELERIAKLKKRIETDRAEKDGLASLEDIMVSFRDHLIGKVAPTLAELTSHVLGATTGGRYDRVELDEGYEMQVWDEGELHPINRFSGGEADLANLALRLAVSRVIAERTGANPINFLILDEIFGSLDPERKRSVMVALSGLSAQFRQIFLITHIEDIKDLMGHVVRVERSEDGTSRVSMAE